MSGSGPQVLVMEDSVALQLWLPQSSSVAVVWGWESGVLMVLISCNLKLRRLNKGAVHDLMDDLRLRANPCLAVQCLCTNAPQRVGV